MEANYGEQLAEQLQETQQRIQKLRKLGARQLPVTDPDSRFLHTAADFTLGYTVDLAVSDSASLVPLVEN